MSNYPNYEKYAFRATEDDVQRAKAAKAPRGSYLYMLKDEKTNMKWPNWLEYESWKRNVEEREGVRFVIKGRDGGGLNYVENLKMVCSRENTGGERGYQKRGVPRESKESRKLEEGCPCSLTVKTYLETTVVTGSYCADHSHPTGNDNLKYCPVSKECREGLKNLCREGVGKHHALQLVTQGKYNQNELEGVVRLREELVGRRDVAYAFGLVKAEKIQKHPIDAISVSLWADELELAGSLLGFKRRNDPPPPGHNIDDDAFIMMIQTPWQRKRWEEIGDNYLGIDATHNTTHYEGFLLFTLMARDRWGCGLPVAWMIASNGKEATITFFLRAFRALNTTIPTQVLTDQDDAQINAIRTVYPTTRIFLCLWHLLHTWRGHIRTQDYPEAWSHMQRLPRATNKQDFDKIWLDIVWTAPQDTIAYMVKNYNGIMPMWSFAYRQKRSIWELQDTNNLVEAWHHKLKGELLGGKRNHRLDVICHTLVNDALGFFKYRHDRQEHGLEGMNLEDKRRKGMNEAGEKIPYDSIKVIDSKGTLLVSSQTQPNTVYAVDLGRPSCTCHSFETEGISYCKHVAAAHYTFPHFKRAARRINPIAPESFEPPSWSPSIDPAPPYSPAIQQQDPPQQPEQPPGTSKHALWEPVRKQLQMLASQEHPDLSRATIDDIERFKELLGVFYAVPRPQKRSNMAILGPALRLPPNQNTATETARAMGKRKSKPKTRYSGPYDAGERPGKFVKGQHIPPPLQHVPPPASHPNVLYSTQSATILPPNPATPISALQYAPRPYPQPSYVVPDVDSCQMPPSLPPNLRNYGPSHPKPPYGPRPIPAPKSTSISSYQANSVGGTLLRARDSPSLPPIASLLQTFQPLPGTFYHAPFRPS